VLLISSASFMGCYEPRRARTSDPLVKSQLLYRLSYRPISTGSVDPEIGKGKRSAKKNGTIACAVGSLPARKARYLMCLISL
jgi:hypothetical protein